ncbi:MAG: hypothetical protein IPH28_20355 [Cytophagaceae bacterium]|nr:hypothetical protein [Cytophagaceae bacterium]MBK9508185.1 hypothetical protein [Cytophagaceae bacterium]MBK9936581.1 hypothetical protein [Cytophagaceae bacterium]MBL0300335.1 hypothetical protein [Cytophagaceae bacterium]MBL0327267.1 hypothetical protein [Cytophagaceae bacterium]
MLNELLIIGIPAILVLTVLFLIYNYFLNRHFNFAKIKSTQEIALPLRLQAYERMALFLERIKPENLLTRLPLDQISLSDLQSHIVGDIRNELHHNAAQQIYVADDTWKLIEITANSTISDLHSILQQLPKGNSAKEGSLHILKTQDLPCKKLISSALDKLREDMNTYF